MRQLWMILFVGLGLPTHFLQGQTPAKPAEEKKPKEDPKITAAWKELEGRWQKIGVAYDTHYNDVTDKKIELVITRDSETWYNDGEKNVRITKQRTVIVDPTKKPAHMDLIGNIDNPVPTLYKAVYSIEDDELRIVCFGYTHRLERPESLDTPIWDKRRPIAIIYKRVKKKD